MTSGFHSNRELFLYREVDPGRLAGAFIDRPVDGSKFNSDDNDRRDPTAAQGSAAAAMDAEVHKQQAKRAIQQGTLHVAAKKSPGNIFGS